MKVTARTLESVAAIAVGVFLGMLIIFLLGSTARCQERSAAVGGYVAGGSKVGLRSAIVGVHGTVNLPVHRRVVLTTDGFWLPLYDKHGNGSAFGFEARGRIYVGKPIFATVGIQRTTAYFQGSGRTSTHALFGGGYSNRQVGIEGYYATPDRTRYRTQKIGGRLDFWAPAGGKWILSLRPGVEYFWYGFEGQTYGSVKPNVSFQAGRRF